MTAAMLVVSFEYIIGNWQLLCYLNLKIFQYHPSVLGVLLVKCNCMLASCAEAISLSPFTVGLYNGCFFCEI